ncbi:MAG: efflux RND transporter permease subunit [Bacteroidales bacterium]|nr:efflux RND transporter permease subunit [Bacteroidales bacterium]
MKNNNGFIHSVIRYRRIIFFLVSILVVFGIWGLLNINKDEFPTFEIKDGLVAGVYPGATAKEVEEQLTRPLEELLFKFPEVKRSSYSYTQDGICYIYVNLDCEPEEKNEIWAKIKLKLNASRMLFPSGVLAIQVLDEFSSVSSILIAMDSDDKSYNELEQYACSLKERLYEIPELANVTVLGQQKEEIAVTIDKDRLSSYGVNSAIMTLDYKNAVLQTISGRFRTDYISAPIHIEGKLSIEQEIGERAIWSDPQGRTLRLKDIATIERRYKDPSSIVKYNGRNALVISVEMGSGNNIVAFGEKVDRLLEEFKGEIPESVHLSKVSDQPKVVDTSVWSFLRDLLVSMLVVIIVMLMLFPIRSALIASSGVPVCTAASIAVMYILGMDLNTVTLAALIVVLGMIVDDSVITMDGYMDKIGKGFGKIDAAQESMKELFVPMLLSTASISAMFFPMLGIITDYLGDFVSMFPWIIAIALGASLVYAVCVVPSLEVMFIKPLSEQKKGSFARIQEKFFDLMQGGYEALQKICFRHPGWTVGCAVASVVLGGFLFTKLNIQMMPMAAREFFAIEVNLSPNSTLAATQQVTDSLEKILLADRRITSVTSFIGTGAPRFHATYGPKIPSEAFAQLIVNTRGPKATEAVIRDYEKKYEYWFPQAQIRFKQLDYQGVTAPVTITFKGDGIARASALADSLKAFMLADMDDCLKWIHSDSDRSISTVSVDLNEDEATRLGVNRALMSLSIASSLGGQTAANIWEGGKSIPINFYSNGVGAGMQYNDLGNLNIITSIPNTSVPLRQIADISPSWQPEGIAHTGGKQSISIYADMRSGKSQPVAMKRIDRYVKANILPNLPEGIELEYGGLSSTNKKVLPEIGLTLLCAIVVLFAFLLYHFKKIRLSILTMVLSLLCLFGASFGLFIFSLDFSMTAVLGIVSLIGIVVRNGILMFEFAETLRNEQGLSAKQAAMEAGRRRMRPIFLTSCTTALGVLPMILSGDVLWMPMGVVICFGIVLSIVMIVEVMPVCYWLLFARSGADKDKLLDSIENE